MTISVNIPKEITEYERKWIAGLSIRKLVCLVIDIVLAIVMYFILTSVLGLTTTVAAVVIILMAMPLMFLGFYKKNGLPFEKYLVLLLRHMRGINRLYFAPELVIDAIKIEAEGGSKYGWIFEKGKQEGKAKRPRKEQRAGIAISECSVGFQVTKAIGERNRKAAQRAIKAARQESGAAKRRVKAEAKAGRRT